MTTAVKSAGECNNEILEFDNSLSEYTPLITKYNVPQELPNGGDAGVYVGKTKRCNFIAFVIVLTLSTTSLAMSYYSVLIQGKVNYTLADLCAVGLKNRKISDASIHGSPKSTGAELARLDENTGAWCSYARNTGGWINITFPVMKDIVGIVTQGSPLQRCWTSSYSVSCGDDAGHYRDITEFGFSSPQIFEGNADNSGKVVNIFARKYSCKSVAIHPKSSHGRPCLRLEILHGPACNFAKKHEFYVESSGTNDGDECKLMMDGREHAENNSGHCVGIFDIKPNAVNINVKTFDTYDPCHKPGAMLDFFNNAPHYSIILIAVRHSGDYISSEVTALLRRFGAVGSSCQVQVGENDSWAFIGQKVQRGDPRPSWLRCQHVSAGGGKAAVHVTVYTSAHYNSLETSPIG